MAQTKRKNSADVEGVFLLKLVLYVIVGSLWLKIHGSPSASQIPIPVGLIVGLIFTSHEHFRINRKIEYAVLVLAALIGLMVPYGLFINL